MIQGSPAQPTDPSIHTILGFFIVESIRFCCLILLQLQPDLPPLSDIESTPLSQSVVSPLANQLSNFATKKHFHKKFICLHHSHV
jgi:hypothetical protein